MVYQIRHKEHGSWEGQIKAAPYLYVSDDDARIFLLFDLEVRNPILGSMERMIG